MDYTSKPVIPEQLNPDLTRELKEEVAFFMKWGYLVVEDALKQTQIEQLREAFSSITNTKGTFTHELLEEDDRFEFLLDHPPVLTRMKAILGNCIQLHSATGRLTEPGTEDQTWHRDTPWPVDSAGTPYGSIPGQINCGYYLDELTLENGPIVVLPGSHRVPFKPPVGFPAFPDELRILAKPGQAIIFDGALFHRGAANNSQGKRRVCLMCYQNAWMKSRESFNGPRMSKLRETGSSEIKLLLGEIKNW
jgi:hypothetical protein